MLHKTQLSVLKIGSSLLVDAQRRLRLEWMEALAEDIVSLHHSGKRVILVSSGAVALGRSYLNAGNSKLALHEKQASAACGQPLLMAAWQKAFAPHGLHTAQLLLTQQDTENRRSYLNARNTLLTLLEAGIIPVINENDTVATAELRYGDNDRLAARVAQMAGAETLVLLSDIDGLYTANPQTHPQAQHLPEIAEITPEIEAMAGGTQAEGVGSGGMITKIEAAKIAVKSGCNTYICCGHEFHPLQALLAGGKHTVFRSKVSALSARKQWITGAIQPSGEVTVDEGAAAALHQGKSLLLVGVKTLKGDFTKGDLLAVYDPTHRLVAKGLSNHDARDAFSLMGKRSADLGEVFSAELIHRNNLVMENPC